MRIREYPRTNPVGYSRIRIFASWRVTSTRTIQATDASAIEEATAVLDEKRLAVVPTDTLYALAADALDEDAVQEVFRAKRRAADQALPVCVGSFEEALQHV